jgi:hypothetical protein
MVKRGKVNPGLFESLALQENRRDLLYYSALS